MGEAKRRKMYRESPAGQQSPMEQEAQRNLLLLEACKTGRTTRVAKLLREGADKETYDPDYRFDSYTNVYHRSECDPEIFCEMSVLRLTPLLIALQNNREPVVLILLDAGTDTRCRDENGAGIWHYVAGKNMLRVAQWLCDHNISADDRDGWYATPFHNVADADMVPFLKKAGCPLNTSGGEEGGTPLENVAKESGAKAMRLARALLDSGADPSLVNLHDYQYESPAMQRLILQYRNAHRNAPCNCAKRADTVLSEPVADQVSAETQTRHQGQLARCILRAVIAQGVMELGEQRTRAKLVAFCKERIGIRIGNGRADELVAELKLKALTSGISLIDAARESYAANTHLMKQNVSLGSDNH